MSIYKKKPNLSLHPPFTFSINSVSRAFLSQMMKTVMANGFPSRRHFHRPTRKVRSEEEDGAGTGIVTSEQVQGRVKETEIMAAAPKPGAVATAAAVARRRLQAVAVSRLRSVLTVFAKNRSNLLVGTLFGHRRGHVHFAFQKDPTSRPAMVMELATPVSGLVKEMASGLVRIALECDRKEGPAARRLAEEARWRSYCNGKRCGVATRRECGAGEWEFLKALEPISTGAGVLPGEDGGELMYMRARFDRIVGSRDAEAFYMMNPDGNGAPELSIYLLRV